MAWYHITIAMVAVLSAVACRGDRRAFFVVVLCAINYLSTVLYVRFGMIYPVVFAGFCDALCAATIYCTAKYRWELLAERLFLSMLLINIIYGFSTVYSSPNPLLYQFALELVTVLVFLFAGGQRILNLVEKNGHAFGRIGNYLRPLAHSLHKKRADIPWIYN